MIILVGGEKGGTGKSTIATNLATMRTMKGVDTLLFDIDPQKTSIIFLQELLVVKKYLIVAF
jgi:chromosome partitioning protein